MPRLSTRGFTLVELLTVLGIIILLSTLGAVAFKNIGRGNTVRGAVDLAASLALNARIEASTYGLQVKLAIDNTDTTAATGKSTDLTLGNKWRRMAVFKQSLTNSSLYVLAGKPVYLPKGAYFSTTYSGGYTFGTAAETLTFSGNTGTPCMVYNFNGQGQYVNSSNPATKAQLVFINGIMDDSTGNLTVQTTMLNARNGFILRSNGRPAYFQDVSQINTP